MELMNNARWPLGRIVKTFPGTDDQIRAVDVRHDHKTYRRATSIVDHAGGNFCRCPPECSGPATNRPEQLLNLATPNTVMNRTCHINGS